MNSDGNQKKEPEKPPMPPTPLPKPDPKLVATGKKSGDQSQVERRDKS
jgi:hypothetical protein